MKKEDQLLLLLLRLQKKTDISHWFYVLPLPPLLTQHARIFSRNTHESDVVTRYTQNKTQNTGEERQDSGVGSHNIREKKKKTQRAWATPNTNLCCSSSSWSRKGTCSRRSKAYMETSHLIKRVPKPRSKKVHRNTRSNGYKQASFKTQGTRNPQ